MVGEAPPLDLDAVAAAVDAFDALRRAREGERDTLDEGLRWLALGNVWGIAGLVLAVVLVASGHEPTSPLVYTAVVAAAAGPISTGFLGLCRRSLAAMRTRAATTEWAAALEASGFDTFGTLHARRLAHAAWVRRAEEAAVAGAAARDARAAWHRVAGPRSHPREAPALAARVGRLRCAQLELFGALLAERLAAPTLRPAAVPGREEGRLDPVVETPFGRSGFRMR